MGDVIERPVSRRNGEVEGHGFDEFGFESFRGTGDFVYVLTVTVVQYFFQVVLGHFPHFPFIRPQSLVQSFELLVQFVLFGE